MAVVLRAVGKCDPACNLIRDRTQPMGCTSSTSMAFMHSCFGYRVMDSGGCVVPRETARVVGRRGLDSRHTACMRAEWCELSCLGAVTLGSRYPM